MSPVFDFFFGAYSTYDSTAIILEGIAVVFGFLSVGLLESWTHDGDISI